MPEATSISNTPLILLAGGKSSRMNMPKGLIPYQGRPWLEIQIERCSRAGIKNLIVVLGYSAEEYFQECPWLQSAQSQKVSLHGVGVEVVLNRRPEFGPFSSIQAAASVLGNMTAQSVFILPVDVPAPEPETWKLIFNSNATIRIPTYKERGGHPVLLPRVWLEQLKVLDPSMPDSRLDIQIRKFDPNATPGATPSAIRTIARIPVNDPLVTVNLNSPEDWHALDGLLTGASGASESKPD